MPDNFSDEEKKIRKIKEDKVAKVLKYIIGETNSGDSEKIGRALFKRHPGYVTNSEISFQQIRDMMEKEE